ncbi:hypothetical protein N7495_008472 [Penicillium taxi]|uniref:uncharacterized protein n=1 Tax=Penicillium taxi TaxID=168475 RepID=UPI0025450891|nr:uncharacterized protein N7495_008472 [Penicillium taxi]KAJ5888431.1 hypothetical protein N7495_008472 [Penicillium taxi]
MPFLGRLAAVALWVTASSASFYDNNCQIWPNKVIPYCFDSSVTSSYQTQFEKAVKLWTDKGIPVTFENHQDCPTSEDTVRKMLKVSTQSENHMASTYGYLYGDKSGSRIRYQELKIGLDYTPHYKTSTLRKSTKYVGAIAHELGRVMCLLNENQRGDLTNELQWQCENL